MIVVADPLPAVVHRGEAIDLAVHVVSDLRTPIESSTVRATVWGDASTETDIARHEWAGAIPADECTFIGRIEAIVPDATNELVVDLELTGPDLTVTNRYFAPVR